MVTGLEFTSAHREGCCVLTVAGELDLVRARALEVALMRHTSVEIPLVLDLRGVQFMDSEALYVLLRTHHEYGQARQRMIVVPSPAVRSVLEVAGVLHAVALCPSVQDALSVLRDAVAQPEASPVPES